MHKVTIDELMNYMNDSSAAIRCLIFSGLLGKNANREMLVEISNTHKGDTAEVNFQSTDVVTSWTVSEYMQMTLRFSTDIGQTKIDNS